MQETNKQLNSGKQQQEQEQELLNLADNMASAAASFSSHGYDSFISAREILKQAIHATMSRFTNK